jgi:hypothetical protein
LATRELFLLAAGRASGFRLSSATRAQKLSIAKTSRARGGVPWRVSDTHVSPRARIAQGTHELPTGESVQTIRDAGFSPRLQSG